MSAQPDAARRDDRLQPPRVIIIDDDADWCEAMSLVLETSGIGAVAVTDADAALARLARERFDAAIVDVHMPDRWGVDVVRELRAVHGESLPIVIATGALSADGVCAGLLAGADDEFFKCDPDDEIVLKLRRLWTDRLH